MMMLILRSEELKSYPEVALSDIPSKEIATGNWKNVKPVINEKLAPCVVHCPLSIKIPYALDKLAEGKVEQAARIWMADNPFASITGRLCPAICEDFCNRANFDHRISIRELERFIGDKVLELKRKTRKPRATGKRVAIIGSGPAGMMTAYMLAFRGHKVVIYERSEKCGGTLRYLIPPFKLDKKVLDEEFEALKLLDVQLVTSTEIKLEDLDRLTEEFDAVLIAIGQAEYQCPEVEGVELGISGSELLKELISKPDRGREFAMKRVGIFGELSSAIDLARTLIRFKAYPIVVFPESVPNLSRTLRAEVKKAADEGVKFQSMVSIRALSSTEEGKVRFTLSGLRAIESYQGSSMYYIPISEGSFDLVVDLAVYMPTRQMPQKWLSYLGLRPEELLAGEKFRIRDNLFICGSVITGPAMVSESFAQGKLAALEIHEFLMGRTRSTRRGSAKTELNIVQFEAIRTAYFQHSEPLKQRLRRVSQRIADFKEEYLPVSLEEAVRESKRCFSCGHCNSCGNCWLFCPDVAIEWVGSPKFNYNACKGCGLCAEECPRGVIDMVPV